MSNSNKKEEYRVVFHGVDKKEIADKILKSGFNKGTYFAKHLEDAVGYGGKYVFYVVLKMTKINKGYWEIISEKHIPPSRIWKLANFNPKELYYKDITYKFFGERKKVPCLKCGEDIGKIRLSIFGKPTIAKCPKCGIRIN